MINEVWIVHFCGVVGAVCHCHTDATEFRRKEYPHLSGEIRKLIKIHTPQDYGNFCVAQGMKMGAMR